MAKCALITGGSRGIGRAVALRLIRDGYSVAITWRSAEAEAKSLIEEVGDPSRLIAFQAEVSDRSRCEEVATAVLERFETIDALVNNAGVRRDALVYHMSDTDWSEVERTNLYGPFVMTQAVLPAMMKQRRGGIVNVTSLSGLHGVVGQANYSAAKAGLIGFTRSLSREVARSGIRVNCVAPGLVDTDMTATLSPDVRKEMVREIPMRRVIKVGEVASAIAFLLSDDASGITGQVLCVDGGTSA